MASINKNSIYLQFEKQVGERLKKEIEGNINSQVEIAKEDLLAEILNDPVSQEIAAGPTSSPISGVVRKGNLFSYIGFSIERKPIKDILDFIRAGIKTKSAIKARQTSKGVVYVKQVIYVDQQQIEDSSGAQYEGWEGDGNNWIRGIRLGISGFVHYLFKLKNNFKQSRSGTAIQIKTEIGSDNISTPQPEYIIGPLNKFVNTVKNLQIKEIFKVR